MKDVMGIVLQIIFLVTGLASAFWLLYFVFKSPGKEKNDSIDLNGPNKKEKFAGRA